MFVIAHTSRANHKTLVTYPTALAAQTAARFMKRSPKTKALLIYESALAPQWPQPNGKTIFADCPTQFIYGIQNIIDRPMSPIERALLTDTFRKQNSWFKVWHWLTDKCRIRITNHRS